MNHGYQNHATPKKNIYDKITDRLLAMIDSGTIPWKAGHNCRGARPGFNAVSGKGYRGVNAMMTWFVAIEAGYESPYWLTYKQAKELGGNVKKGEKGTPVLYFGRVEADAEKERDGFMFAKGYTVFNVSNSVKESTR